MNEKRNAFELLSNASFEIGGQNQLAELRAKHTTEPSDDESERRLETDWERLLGDLHIRTGTLLKADTVSFLLGAGASKECGGPLISTVPLEIEQKLVALGCAGSTKPRVREWLKCFYLAARACGAANAPSNREDLLSRRQSLETGNADALNVSLEHVLSRLHRWRSAMPNQGGRLRLTGEVAVDQQSEVIEEALRKATLTLAQLCKLPRDGMAAGLVAHKDLLRKVLMRPLNLKRANIFTPNYDTLVEQAADSEGVVLIDGFVGTVRRAFRPESYDQDLYFPAETTEGRVHRLDRVLHLYKLHGSVTWTDEEPTWDNPYGIRAHGQELPDDNPVLIFPTPAKSGEALGMPYSELLRRFASAVVRPQSVLFVLGYGFGDEHIRAIVRQALAIPSLMLVIVDPNPHSEFVKELRCRKDRRVWVFSGTTFGTFSDFIRYALADLRDEDVRRKVVETHRALAKDSLQGQQAEASGD